MIRQQGLSLVEVMVGLVLVALSVVGLVTQTQVLSQQSSSLTQSDLQARFAGRMMQEIQHQFDLDPTGVKNISVVSGATTGTSATGLLAQVLEVESDLFWHAATESVYQLGTTDTSVSWLAGPVLGDGSYTLAIMSAKGFITSANIDLLTDTVAPYWLDSGVYGAWRSDLASFSLPIEVATIAVSSLSPQQRLVVVNLGGVQLQQRLNVPGF